MKKANTILTLLLLLVFISSCKGNIDNISTTPKELMEGSIFLNDYEEIDYEDLQGEEYYFYLFADCFLKELSSFLEEESLDISELEKSISTESDSRENILQYISDIKEKKYVISKYVFLRTKDDSTSFNDFMEVVVLAEFCVDGQTIEKKCLLLSVQKYYGEEDVTWKLEGIENLQ